MALLFNKLFTKRQNFGLNHIGNICRPGKKRIFGGKDDFVVDMVEKFVVKGQNGEFPHSLHFPQCCPKASSAVLLNLRHLVKDNFFFLLTHFQMTNFRLFQTERVCRRQFQI